MLGAIYDERRTTSVKARQPSVSLRSYHVANDLVHPGFQTFAVQPTVPDDHLWEFGELVLELE